MSSTVKVGVGVIVENTKGEVLIGKRKGSHAPFYSIPGGNLEQGETFEQAAAREILEETGLEVDNLKVIAVTNNLETYQRDGVHYISVILHTTSFTGEPQILEPDKCEELFWCDPNKVPDPQFDASRLGLECFVSGMFYEGIR